MSIEIGRRPIDDKPITSCVCLPSGGHAASNAAPKGPRLTHERTVILRTLKTAIEEYGEPPIAALGLPQSVARVVNARRWKEVYLTKAPDPGATDSPIDKRLDNTINKRLRDASNQFQTLGVIGRANPFVWIVPGKKSAEVLDSLGPQPEFPEDIR